MPDEICSHRWPLVMLGLRRALGEVAPCLNAQLTAAKFICIDSSVAGCPHVPIARDLGELSSI